MMVMHSSDSSEDAEFRISIEGPMLSAEAVTS